MPLVPSAEAIRRTVLRIYLTRFSLWLGVVLLGYPYFATRVAPTMFRSTLIVTTWGLVFVSFSVTASAFTVIATRHAVISLAQQRFGVDLKARSAVRSSFTPWLIGLATPLIASVAVLSYREGSISWWGAIWAPVTGGLAAIVFMTIVDAVRALLTRANQQLRPYLTPMTPLLAAAHNRKIGVSVRLPANGPVLRLVRWIRPYLGPGYLDAEGQVHLEHLFSGGLFLAYFAVYATGFWAFAPTTALGPRVPAVVHLLTTVTLATWLLAGMSFYLDRHRLPTLSTVLVLSLVIWAFANTDYYFDLHPRPPQSTYDLDSPEQVADVRKHDVLTVVAVDGGGIQAAGWGATVLAGLTESWPGFQQSVRLISSVSGGSVATMYYTAALEEFSLDRPVLSPAASQHMQTVRELAVTPSLNEAGWGLAYPDLLRSLFPFFQSDRGWAMEQAWARNLKRIDRWKDNGPTLRDMSSGIREGWRPAVSMNATLVESGNRFSFATFNPPPEWKLETPATMSGLKDHDLSLATAARLSATFPWVTPISRARPDGMAVRAVHFADGGYYDNTGMGIAMRWLDTALERGKRPTKTVAFVRIRSGPTITETKEKDRGWLYQTVGPIVTLLSVRKSAQYERSDTELEFLQRLWYAKAKINICSFEFSFEKRDSENQLQKVPLSWQLTSTEIEDLKSEWNSPRNRNTLQNLMYLGSNPEKACPTPREFPR